MQKVVQGPRRPKSKQPVLPVGGCPAQKSHGPKAVVHIPPRGGDEFAEPRQIFADQTEVVQ